MKKYTNSGRHTKNIKTKPDLLLEEGDRIGSLEVIATPGHTPGSIALLIHVIEV